jgi:hypothetical protein
MMLCDFSALPGAAFAKGPILPNQESYPEAPLELNLELRMKTFSWH